MYIVLRFILEIWDESNNRPGKIRIRCNNLAGFLDSTQTKLKTKRLKTSRLILRAIKENIAALTGHQDDAENVQNLTRWAQLNLMADHKVRQRLSEFLIQGNEAKLSSFYRKGWSCWPRKKKCIDFTKQKLYKWIYKKQAREYWSRKNKVTHHKFDLIYWNLVERVMSKKSQLYKVWFSKHHSWLRQK